MLGVSDPSLVWVPGTHLLLELSLFRDGGRGNLITVAAGHRRYIKWPKKLLLA